MNDFASKEATPLASPLPASERIGELDAVRGFALLGILLMNIEFFTRPLQGVLLGFDTSLTGPDYQAGWLVYVFVQGKFWTLFALLFGAGFALTMERAERRGGAFVPGYLRRMLVLLLIGSMHALLIWFGDILVSYALAGSLLLMFFRHTPVARLWKWGLALYLLPMAMYWSAGLSLEVARSDPAEYRAALADSEKAEAAIRREYAEAERNYRDGGFVAATRQRIHDAQQQLGWLPLTLMSALGMFLIGACLLRSGALRNPSAHRPLFRKFLWIGLPLGALLAVWASRHLIGAPPLLPTLSLAASKTAMTIANLLLALGYLSALMLAIPGPLPVLRSRLQNVASSCQSGEDGAQEPQCTREYMRIPSTARPRITAAQQFCRRLLGDWLAPVGRMALSNYLLQSLFFTTLFYGYGFGLWGQVSRYWQVLLALTFFVVQMALSRLWLMRFRFGPVEWLWRALTYGRLKL